MIQKNRYFSRSKISEAKFREILRYFAMDLTATDCSELSGISVRSVNTIYLRIRIRRRLAEHCEQVSPLGGELEADESYFGPRRKRGLNRPGFELTPEVGRLLSRRSGGACQPVSHRAETSQSELVVVVNVIVHARFKCLNAFNRCKIEVLGF